MGKGKRNKKTIPFHKVPIDGYDNLINGLEIALSNNRLVQVHQIEKKAGLHITITKDIDKDKQSELKFALTPEAANALAQLILMQQDKG